MDFVTILMIAVALAMDAFAVSITNGLAMCTLRIRYALVIALFFGSFQSIMPFLGWLAGLTLKSFIVSIDHWIAFVLLSFIGGKMIYESTVLKKEAAADKHFERPGAPFAPLRAAEEDYSRPPGAKTRSFPSEGGHGWSLVDGHRREKPRPGGGRWSLFPRNLRLWARPG